MILKIFFFRERERQRDADSPITLRQIPEIPTAHHHVPLYLYLAFLLLFGKIGVTRVTRFLRGPEEFLRLL